MIIITKVKLKIIKAKILGILCLIDEHLKSKKQNKKHFPTHDKDKNFFFYKENTE